MLAGDKSSESESGEELARIEEFRSQNTVKWCKSLSGCGEYGLEEYRSQNTVRYC